MNGTPCIEQPNRLEIISENQENDTVFIEVQSMHSSPRNSFYHSRQSSMIEHKSAAIPLEKAVHSHNQLSSTIALIRRKFLLVHESKLPLQAKLALMSSLREKLIEIQKLQRLNSLSLKYHVLGFREEKIDVKKQAPLEITETVKMIAQRHLALQPNFHEKRLTKLASPRIGNSYLSSFVSQSTACDALEELKELEESKKQEIKKYHLLVKDKKALAKKQRIDLQYAQDDLVEINELLQTKKKLLTELESRIKESRDNISQLSQKGAISVRRTNSKTSKMETLKTEHLETPPETDKAPANKIPVVFYSPRGDGKGNYFGRTETETSRLNTTIIGDISSSIKNLFRRKSKQDSSSTVNILPPDLFLKTEPDFR